MIEASNLIDIQLSLDEFMNRALEFNLNSAKHLPSGDRWNFYKHMEGLSKFGQMLFNSEHDVLKLYSYGSKYYAIDSTGLSYGFIHKPSEIIPNSLGNYHPYPYYGESSIYTYDCVVKTRAQSDKDGALIGLDFLRKNYLPLPKGPLTDHRTQRYYFPDSSLTSDYYHYRRYQYENLPVIYKTNERSFYIPFEELIRKELKLTGHKLSISPVFERDYIHFQAVLSWRQGGGNFGYDKKTWHGKISYETFDIIQVTEIEEEYALKKYMKISNEVKQLVRQSSTESLKKELDILIRMPRSGDLIGNVILLELQSRISKGIDKEDFSLPSRLY